MFELTVTGTLHRVHSRNVQLKSKATAKLKKNMPRTLRVARWLALAHSLMARMEVGEFCSFEEMAEVYGVSRARISQILDLALLAPDIQEEILKMRIERGTDPVTEHNLRPMSREILWSTQRALWAQLKEAHSKATR